MACNVICAYFASLLIEIVLQYGDRLTAFIFFPRLLMNKHWEIKGLS